MIDLSNKFYISLVALFKHKETPINAVYTVLRIKILYTYTYLKRPWFARKLDRTPSLRLVLSSGSGRAK